MSILQKDVKLENSKSQEHLFIEPEGMKPF